MCWLCVWRCAWSQKVSRCGPSASITLSASLSLLASDVLQLLPMSSGFFPLVARGCCSILLTPAGRILGDGGHSRNALQRVSLGVSTLGILCGMLQLFLCTSTRNSRQRLLQCCDSTCSRIIVELLEQLHLCPQFRSGKLAVVLATQPIHACFHPGHLPL